MLHAQEPACGIHTITETLAPVYPPIAKAAHVSGDVMLVVTLEHDGSVSEAEVIRGPEMLKKSAIDFVKGWRADQYGGSRACPVTIRFELAYSTCTVGESDHPLPPGVKTKRIDSQHYVVAGQGMTICDPGATLGRKRRFLGIFELKVFMRYLSIEQAHRELHSILESGETVIIERDGRPIAELVPSGERPKRDPAERAAIMKEMRAILERGIPMGATAPSRDEMHER